MRHIYENASGRVQRIFLRTESTGTGNTLTISPGSKVELSYPGLDIYVPHLLHKINDRGFNISHSVITARRSEESFSKSEVVAVVQDNVPSVTDLESDVKVVEGIDKVPDEETGNSDFNEEVIAAVIEKTAANPKAAKSFFNKKAK